ncbi:hypothetical protein GCM10023077_16490 [Mycolicibacterium helvum]
MVVVDTPGSAGTDAAGLLVVTPDSLSQLLTPKVTAAIIAIAAQRVACCCFISNEPVDFGREKQVNTPRL